MGGVFGFVLVAQLILVAVAGTDIPFHDQWDIEGRWLYPMWLDGTFRAGDLLRPLNEHRIGWTHALNLALFTLNGQWDPLVQLVAIAMLRAACAAGLAWAVAVRVAGREQLVVFAVVGVAFLPHLGWHNALWGNQSQVIFAVGWSLLAFWSWAEPERSVRRTIGGLVAGGAALLAMAPGGLVPVAFLGLAALRAGERRRIDARFWHDAGPALGLLLIAGWARATVSEHAALGAATLEQFWGAAMKTIAWPHGGTLLVALAMNTPLMVAVGRRLAGRRHAVPGEDFVLLVAGWSLAIALAIAWARGGSAELSAGVPSRYVDFVMLLPLANIWCALALGRELAGKWPPVRWTVAVWCGFVLIGWIGLSAEVMRGLVLPRARDREAPVRLMQAYQATGDARVFEGRPRLLVPHPDPANAVRKTLDDPRLRGKLPPSLQPAEPLGPLSRAVRIFRGAPTEARRQ